MVDAAASPPKARRVGILIDGFVGLAGAADFLTSLVDAMSQTADGREIVLLMRLKPWRRLVRGIGASAIKLAKDVAKRRRPELPPLPGDPQAVVERMVREGLRRLPLYTAPASDAALERLCLREGIDVVMPTHYALTRYRLPWVGYIYDFQHRYYPHFFAPRVRRLRDRQFEDMLRYPSTVIVNARQVKLDAERFHTPKAKIVPLPFSASPDPRWFKADPQAVRVGYGIGRRYFMISNQFWLHKRHEVAIEAFLRMAKHRDDVELVCTGATDDSRAPDHFARLQTMIAASEAAPRIHILGLIPKQDQIALLRGCLAVVQPTAFEGGPGGGCVFDAVAFGIRSIVSDLPVNREIEEYVTEYFPLDDVEALEAVMMRVADMPAPVQAGVDELISRGSERRAAMGRALWNAADHAVAAHARKRRR